MDERVAVVVDEGVVVDGVGIVGVDVDEGVVVDVDEIGRRCRKPPEGSHALPEGFTSAGETDPVRTFVTACG